MKKFLTILFCTLFFTPSAEAFEEIIALETETKPSFSSTVLDNEESDDNPVVKIEDSTIYKQEESQLRLKSGIADYNPETASAYPGMFLLNIFIKP